MKINKTSLLHVYQVSLKFQITVDINNTKKPFRDLSLLIAGGMGTGFKGGGHRIFKGLESGHRNKIEKLIVGIEKFLPKKFHRCRGFYCTQFML